MSIKDTNDVDDMFVGLEFLQEQEEGSLSRCHYCACIVNGEDRPDSCTGECEYEGALGQESYRALNFNEEDPVYKELIADVGGHIWEDY